MPTDFSIEFIYDHFYLINVSIVTVLFSFWLSSQEKLELMSSSTVGQST